MVSAELSPNDRQYKDELRKDILLDLIERGEARGVIEHSDLQKVLSNPLIVRYFKQNVDLAKRFVRFHSRRDIEILDRDLDKSRYTALPMVIDSNSVIWEAFIDNIIGEKIHYPNKYRDMVLPGRPFVYFRNTPGRKGKRARNEYIGIGTIGEVSPDPSNKGGGNTLRRLKWYASVKDFQRFDNPVPWKDGGNPLEDIEDHEWVDPIRDISVDTYARILELSRSPVGAKDATMPGGVEPAQILDLLSFNKFMEDCGIGVEEEADLKGKLVMADIHEVSPSAVESSSLVMTIRARPSATLLDSKPASGTAPISYRRSKHSVAIGTRAEEIVVLLLREEAESMGYKNIRWVSTEGEKPGWDIEMIDAQGDLHSIEVKGTSGKVFPSIELTAAEWQAAEKGREKFWMFLVTECLGKHPKVQRVKDPVSLVRNGTLALSPVLWRLELSSRDSS